MKRLLLACMALATCLCYASSVAQTRSIKDCDGVLVPTVEQTSDDYSRMQDYLFEYAAREYDRLQKLNAEQRQAEASYKVAQAEYNESKTASEFQDKLRARIQRERSTSRESMSSANYRRGLESAQVAAWTTCARTVSGAGAVLLVAENVDPSAFPLTVTWYPGTGQTRGKLTLKVANASIDGKNQTEAVFTGPGSIPFIVRPDSSTSPIVLTAAIEGSADALSLPRKFPAPSKAPVICVESDRVKRYSASDDFTKAETNFAPCLTHRAFTGRAPNIDSWYRISILERGRLTVALSGTSEEFELQLRDSKGQDIARPTPRRARGSQTLSYTVVQPGEYLVRPQPISGPSDYELSITFVPR